MSTAGIGVDDARWAERDRDRRERDPTPRDTFTRHVRLPARTGAGARSRPRPRIHPYADPSRARSRPSARFEWSPVVISGTTTIALPIHGRATSDIFERRG